MSRRRLTLARKRDTVSAQTPEGNHPMDRATMPTKARTPSRTRGRAAQAADAAQGQSAPEGAYNLYPANYHTEFRELHLWHAHWGGPLCERDARATRRCGVHPRTFRRWLTGRRAPPHHALELLRVLGLGDLGEIHKDWRGWRITGTGNLISPYGNVIRPGEIDADRYSREIAAALRLELQAKERQLEEARGHGDARGESEARLDTCRPRSGHPATAFHPDSSRPAPARRPSEPAQWFGRGEGKAAYPGQQEPQSSSPSDGGNAHD